MPRKTIHAALDTLHEQLRDPSNLDDSDREHLREVLHDIERALDDHPEGEPMGDRLRQSVANFETSHPTVSGALHAIMESLSKL